VKYIIVSTVFIISISANALYAQSNFQHIDVISGKVIYNSNGNEIPFAHVFNESERTWVHAKEDGHFSIWAGINDTIVVSAVGFEPKMIALTDSLLQKEFIQIKLEPQIYEIGEATVTSLKTYSGFKQDILDLDLPTTALDSVGEELSTSSKEVALLADYEREVDEIFDRTKGTLFVLEAPFRSKNEKDKRKLKKIQSKAEEQNIIHRKYNRKLVKQYTGLDEDKLDSFINFCNFNTEFILKSNEYEIAEAIYNMLIEHNKKN